MVPMVVRLQMAAQVGFASLTVTGGSYGCFLWCLWLFGCGWLPRYALPASKLRAVCMDGSYGFYGCWVADGCRVGVTDDMAVYVLDEEQLAPLPVR